MRRHWRKLGLVEDADRTAAASSGRQTAKLLKRCGGYVPRDSCDGSGLAAVLSVLKSMAGCCERNEYGWRVVGGSEPQGELELRLLAAGNARTAPHHLQYPGGVAGGRERRGEYPLPVPFRPGCFCVLLFCTRPTLARTAVNLWVCFRRTGLDLGPFRRFWRVSDTWLFLLPGTRSKVNRSYQPLYFN